MYMRNKLNLTGIDKRLISLFINVLDSEYSRYDVLVLEDSLEVCVKDYWRKSETLIPYTMGMEILRDQGPKHAVNLLKKMQLQARHRMDIMLKYKNKTGKWSTGR
jgi:hypothetical protein